MPTETSPETREARVRTARAALIDDHAASLYDLVRLAFCEPTRAQIIRALGTGPLSVNEVAAVVKRSKWATSQHLRVLRENNLVAAARNGRSVVYTLGKSQAARVTWEALDGVLVAAGLGSSERGRKVSRRRPT